MLKMKIYLCFVTPKNYASSVNSYYEANKVILKNKRLQIDELYLNTEYNIQNEFIMYMHEICYSHQ